MKPALVDMPEVVDKVRAGLDDPAQADRLAVTVAPGTPRLTADPLRTQQALANIVANALAYSAPSSKVALKVAPQARGGRPGVAVTVRDQGVGLTPEQRGQVYDAFWRAGALPDVPGNGLGMTIVREIVAVHGGQVEIASQPGDGTEVTLWLPVESALAGGKAGAAA